MPPNNSMQRTALRAAADAERYAALQQKDCGFKAGFGARGGFPLREVVPKPENRLTVLGPRRVAER
jgi:hypothetical protein